MFRLQNYQIMKWNKFYYCHAALCWFIIIPWSINVQLRWRKTSSPSQGLFYITIFMTYLIFESVFICGDSRYLCHWETLQWWLRMWWHTEILAEWWLVVLPWLWCQGVVWCHGVVCYRLLMRCGDRVWYRVWCRFLWGVVTGCGVVSEYSVVVWSCGVGRRCCEWRINFGVVDDGLL